MSRHATLLPTSGKLVSGEERCVTRQITAAWETIYSQPKQTEHSYVEFNREQATPDDSSTPSPVTATTEQSEHSPGIDEQQAVTLTFVNDLDVLEVQVQDIQQQDEYETDSDTERDDEVN